MTLSALMKKGGLRELATVCATATRATSATKTTDAARTVAGVATVAVANRQRAPSTSTDAWPRHEDSGAPFCPWGPYVTPEVLNDWRHELRRLVAELATVEEWTDERRATFEHYVERQPGLATLRDDIAYFKERLRDAKQGKKRLDTYSSDWLFDRRFCVDCHGGCIGTSKRCSRRT
ncbi:hypothetical protein [Paraburkholderia azotifigens]|uniref:Uncharacterized protein n=1 Tax=Paraburkholderia azotifigens TaxID=2057004 RepID=A0ABU9R3N0_9BURK